MATTTGSKPRTLDPEQRIVLRGVGWDVYETLLERLEGQAIRMTYDRGDLELMSPSLDHEDYGALLGRLIETVAEELRIPCRATGSTTWRKKVKERGLEADRSFYFENFPRVRGKRKSIDLNVDPPPDL